MSNINKNYFKNICVKFVDVTPDSSLLQNDREREIKDKLTIYLRKKGLPGKLIEVVVSHLKEFDFINDTDFAKWWIMQRGTSAIRGSKIITLELKSKGVKIYRDVVDRDAGKNAVILDPDDYLISLFEPIFEDKAEQTSGYHGFTPA